VVIKLALKFGLAALLLEIISACSPSASGEVSTAGPTSILIPYTTAEAISVSTEVPEIVLPTATPATYLVAEGDTFFSIAATLGINLDALIAANPGVDPRLLTPGTTLLLPIDGGTAQPSLPTPTPVPVLIGETKCYSTAAGELWCLVPIENSLTIGIENVAAVVQLLDNSGDAIASVEASPLINLLESGASMPLVAYFSESPGGWVSSRSQLLSAYSIQESDYYLMASIQEETVNISEGGLVAQVNGHVEIVGGEAGIVWVLAVAYDSNNEMAGFRRWESEGTTEFVLTLYSLGPEIDRVELLVEARP
jgi:LysM repeat protein